MTDAAKIGDFPDRIGPAENGVMFQPSEDDITYFARTNFRNERKPFGIRRRDRRSHFYCIGRTGTGKSTMMETMIRQDIERGEGVALLDPHGDLVERVVENVPPHRKGDFIYFNVPDRTNPLGFNPLEQVPVEKRALVASGLIETFKKIWAESWGPRLEHILRHAILTLLDCPGSTLADVMRLFSDMEFRKNALLQVTSRQVYDFWVNEFAKYPPTLRGEAVAPIQNKLGAFVANPTLNRILGQPKSAFNVRTIMAERKILLVNLSKGKIGEDSAALLGALIVSKLGLAALSRADTPEASRTDFYVYLDEFPLFTTASLANMLSELRKYRLNLVLAHQFLTQLDEEVRDAILGNVGTLVAFRVGLTDAEILENEFYPKVTRSDLVNLPNHNVYLKLMVDESVSEPFSAQAILNCTDKEPRLLKR